MRILVTRPGREAEGTARALRARGHDVFVSPVLEVMPTGVPLPKGPFVAVLATSAQAINALAEAQARSLRTTPLYVVGARTAAAAQARGLRNPEVVAEDGARLAASLREAGLSSRNVLYLAGRDRKPTLEDACAKLDCQVEVAVVYEARPVASLTPEAVAGLRDGSIDAVLHYSRRSAMLTLGLVRKAGLMSGFARARHLCLSKDIATPLSEAGLKVVISPAANTRSLFEMLETS
jgi:uroporphyrinogen-III synthase